MYRRSIQYHSQINDLDERSNDDSESSQLIE
jgi:hypothetical protein